MDVAPTEVHNIVILTYSGAHPDAAQELLETLRKLNSRRRTNKPPGIVYFTQVYSLSPCVLNTVETWLPPVELSAESSAAMPAVIDTLIITDGLPEAITDLPEQTLEWLRATCSMASRVVALGVGVHWLAAAGLLDRRRVATHSALESILAERFPTLMVEPRQGLQVDGHFYTTSERISSSDMLMLLLSHDVASAAPNNTPRQPPHHLVEQVMTTPRSVTAKICTWWLLHIEDDLNMERSALTLNMSERNFRRRFKLETGYPPYLFLLLLRLELARQQLLDSDLPVDKIARRLGLLDGQQLARMFRKYLSASPLEYRRKSKQDWAPRCHHDYARVFNARTPPQWLLGLQNRPVAVSEARFFRAPGIDQKQRTSSPSQPS